jgi:hypothetical protein
MDLQQRTARACRCDRRGFFSGGLGLAAGAAALWLPTAARAGADSTRTPPGEPFDEAARLALMDLRELAAIDAQNGGAAPMAIPWLDKNGSYNQSPGSGQEPASIFHFRGRVARANGYRGMGTDNHGRRIPFGTATTDFSFMQGTYWAGRAERQGAFAHT